MRLFARAFDAYRSWQRRQIAFSELMSLDDRSLADIGLRRGDIPFVVSGEFTIREAVTAADQGAPANTRRATPANANSTPGQKVA